MESIYLTDGQDKLASYIFMPERDCSYIVIVCHGFRGGKENGGNIFGFARRLNDIGFGVVAFDFAGSGASSGDFADVTLSRQVDDLGRIINYVEENYHKRVILLGRSFGGSTVLAKAGDNDRRVAGYILWSTPVKLYETFASMAEAFSSLPAGEVLEIADANGSFHLKPSFIKDFNHHDLEFNLQELGSQPVLIIHGTADDVVDPSNAISIYTNSENAELHIISGADHRFTGNITEREGLTLNWLQKVFIK